MSESGCFALIWFDKRNVRSLKKQRHIINLPSVYEHQFQWVNEEFVKRKKAGGRKVNEC